MGGCFSFLGVSLFEHPNRTNTRTETCRNMRKTPRDIERDIRARVLEGESYESAASGRVGKATVACVVNDLRKSVPDFDKLRE